MNQYFTYKIKIKGEKSKGGGKKSEDRQMGLVKGSDVTVSTAVLHSPTEIRN